MADEPTCTKCGKVATQRCVDGNWWPPCGCGIEYLKYRPNTEDVRNGE